jgi:hypothetical protein
LKPKVQSPPVTKPDSAAAVVANKSGDHLQAKTRLVVDRGAGRGKVEVMLGPRYQSKAWKPHSSIALKGEGYGLLSNRNVAQWEDESGERIISSQSASKTSSAQSASKSFQEQFRAGLERNEVSQEKARKRMMLADRWDGHLDQGKVSLLRRIVPARPISNTGAATWGQHAIVEESQVERRFSKKQ